MNAMSITQFIKRFGVPACVHEISLTCSPGRSTQWEGSRNCDQSVSDLLVRHRIAVMIEFIRRLFDDGFMVQIFA